MAHAARFAVLDLISRTLARVCAWRAVPVSTAAQGRPPARPAVAVKWPTLRGQAVSFLASSGCAETTERIVTLSVLTPGRTERALRRPSPGSRGRRLFSETACREGRPAVCVALIVISQHLSSIVMAIVIMVPVGRAQALSATTPDSVPARARREPPPPWAPLSRVKRELCEICHIRV